MRETRVSGVMEARRRRSLLPPRASLIIVVESRVFV